MPEKSGFQQFVKLDISKILMVIKIIYLVWFVLGMNLISGLHFIKNFLLFLVEKKNCARIYMLVNLHNIVIQIQCSYHFKVQNQALNWVRVTVRV